MDEKRSFIENDDKTAKSLRFVVEALEVVAAAAEQESDKNVIIKSCGTSYAIWPSTVRDAIRGLKLLAAPAPPAEPSVEQCIEAINRASHRGSRGWKLFADGATDQKLNRDELMGLGKLLIERERAEAAKGGA